MSHLENNVSINIKLKELVCPCCKDYIVNERLVQGLQSIRDKANEALNAHEVKIRITSAYRCKKHNDEIGGASSSHHMTGKAADFYLYYWDDGGYKVVKPRGMFFITNKLNLFNGIGVYKKGFIHVDVREEKDFNIWFDVTSDRTYLTECN